MPGTGNQAHNNVNNYCELSGNKSQKIAITIITKEKYKNYCQALIDLTASSNAGFIKTSDKDCNSIKREIANPQHTHYRQKCMGLVF